MAWKLGIRYEVLDGDSVVERFANAQKYGYQAVELPGRYLTTFRDELLASRTRLALPISSISLGFRGSLISSDPECRKVCREDIENLLRLCADLGAIGLVMPPVLHCDPCPRVEAKGREEAVAIEDELLIAELAPLAGHAAACGVHLMLEPVNSFETDYLMTVDHAVRICDQVDHPGMGITVDFFHMQMTELDRGAAIRHGVRWIRHVHVAENTRVEPGPGELDFTTGFAALNEIGYAGYVVTECRQLSGPATEVLPSSVQYLLRLQNSYQDVSKKT